MTHNASEEEGRSSKYTNLFPVTLNRERSSSLDCKKRSITSLDYSRGSPEATRVDFVYCKSEPNGDNLDIRRQSMLHATRSRATTTPSENVGKDFKVTRDSSRGHKGRGWLKRKGTRDGRSADALPTSRIGCTDCYEEQEQGSLAKKRKLYNRMKIGKDSGEGKSFGSVVPSTCLFLDDKSSQKQKEIAKRTINKKIAPPTDDKYPHLNRSESKVLFEDKELLTLLPISGKNNKIHDRKTRDPDHNQKQSLKYANKMSSEQKEIRSSSPVTASRPVAQQSKKSTITIVDPEAFSETAGFEIPEELKLSRTKNLRTSQPGVITMADFLGGGSGGVATNRDSSQPGVVTMADFLGGGSGGVATNGDSSQPGVVTISDYLLGGGTSTPLSSLSPTQGQSSQSYSLPKYIPKSLGKAQVMMNMAEKAQDQQEHADRGQFDDLLKRGRSRLDDARRTTMNRLIFNRADYVGDPVSKVQEEMVAVDGRTKEEQGYPHCPFPYSFADVKLSKMIARLLDFKDKLETKRFEVSIVYIGNKGTYYRAVHVDYHFPCYFFDPITRLEENKSTRLLLGCIQQSLFKPVNIIATPDDQPHIEDSFVIMKETVSALFGIGENNNKYCFYLQTTPQSRTVHAELAFAYVPIMFVNIWDYSGEGSASIPMAAIRKALEMNLELLYRKNGGSSKVYAYVRSLIGAIDAGTVPVDYVPSTKLIEEIYKITGRP